LGTLKQVKLPADAFDKIGAANLQAFLATR